MQNSFINQLKTNPVTPWIVIFVFLAIFSRTGGGTNEYSRYATLRAMSDQQTFKINDYVSWTIDWAQTPDGSYYSNKAPGPMFLAFPAFYLLEQITKFDIKEKFETKIDPVSGKSRTIRPNLPGPTTRTLIALITQLIPYAVLCFLLGNFLLQQGVPIWGVHFMAVALLFGNTASLFANIFFGHALTACLLLFSHFFLLQKKYFWVGLFFGLALLSDYTVTLLGPLVLINLIFANRREFRWMGKLLAGGLLPGILWCWYHISTCGSPFVIPAHFQNPIWQNMKHESHNLWGLFVLQIRWDLIGELIFGSMRGILFTQPWVLCLIPMQFFLYKKILQDKIMMSTSILCLIGLAFLLIMNSSFGGWHGGHTSGPRYLSMVFPIFALMAALFYGHLPKWCQGLLWISLMPSLVLRALIYGSTPLAHEQPIWPYLYNFMI
ncbi:MAG: hypothetical protein AABY86_08220, partial [Bdellovibrionota bacterium]